MVIYGYVDENSKIWKVEILKETEFSIEIRKIENFPCKKKITEFANCIGNLQLFRYENNMQKILIELCFKKKIIVV